MPNILDRFNGLFADQKIPPGGVMGEPTFNPQGDAKLAMASALLSGSAGGPQYKGFTEIMGNALAVGQAARVQAQQLQMRQAAIKREGDQRQQQIDQQARGGLVVGQDASGKPIYQREADLEGKTPYQEPPGLPKLPDGMRYDQAGNPQWIPEYLTGKEQLAAAGRNAGVTVNTGSGFPAPPQGMYRPDPGKPGLAREPGSPDAQPQEQQQKQAIGINNLGVAVDEYTKVLPTLKMIDYLKPDERSRIGLVYNNMMLQAKEAYNLGVLNGPDFEILNKVVTNPMTITGAVTSNEALAKQATELKRIMQKMQKNVTAYADEKNGSQPSNVHPDPLGILK